MSGHPELVVVGLSHRTTPVAVRERLAVPEPQVPGTLRTLCEAGALREAVLISTCNRVELIGTTQDPLLIGGRIAGVLNERVAPQRVEDHLYNYVGSDAAAHVFRVASGLDSLVLGEPQILGQVKSAFTLADKAGTVGALLRRCFDRSFKVAKRVRTETAVATGNVSVSSIACDLAEKIFGSLADRRVMLVGAGKMSEVAARSLTAQGASLFVVNRDPARATKLAEACGGTARPLESLATELSEADVVISSTAKDGFVITHELMQGVCKLRRWRPLFMIDIAVPRDIDPRVDSLRNVFVYDMDDLHKVSRENISARERALDDAELIISQELAEFDRWRRSLGLTPTIVALRQHVRSVLRKELEKTLPKLPDADDRQRKALERMCEAMTNQLLHGPLTEMKQADDSELVETVQRLFRLDVDGGPQPQSTPQAQGVQPEFDPVHGTPGKS